MALYGRANLNSLSLLNYCYCKFATGIVKFKSQSRTSIISNILQKKVNKPSDEKIDLNKSSPFDKEILKRRNQASRSILVQVHSANSYEELQGYCCQFGLILSMHHYHINKQQHYILVEFHNAIAVNEIISHASIVNENIIVSAKSPILWFRKGYPVTFHNRKKMPLFIENGWMLPKEGDLTKLLYNAKSLSGQIISLYEALKLENLETKLRFHTAYHLEQYFSGLFQNIKVLPFGSSINGFGRKRCDVDLVMIPDDSKKLNVLNRLVFHTKSLKHEKHEMKEFLAAIANIMHCFIPGIKNVRRILDARVPIIKFNYEYTHFECDLSATNLTAIYMTELLFLYGEMDWRVRPLVVAIRLWAKCQKVTADLPGHWITNFSLTLLVLFYLQQQNILPSLNTLRKHATSQDVRSTETDIDCTFLRDIKRLPVEYTYKTNQDNLEVLLYGFFEYYSKFDFHTKGICIREGMPIQKPIHANALHITNPLETLLNVSRNVNIYQLNYFTQKVHDTLYTLETTADMSLNNCWGLMTILNMKTDVNRTNFNSSVNEDISNFSEDHSYETADKSEEIDIAQSEVQKNKMKEIVRYPSE